MARRRLQFPFNPKSLPRRFAEGITQATKTEFYGALRDDLTEYIHVSKRKPKADILGLLAVCEFEDALTIMVDQVVQRGERALDLLDEAEHAGAPEDQLRWYRARIQRYVSRERRREAQILRLLNQPPEALELKQVKNLARTLDQRGGRANWIKAAELWQLAAKVATGTSITGLVNSEFFTCCYALAMAKAGEWKDILPILWKMARQEYRVVELRQNFMDAGYRYLLEHAIAHDDRVGFMNIWREAISSGEAYKAYHNYFPLPHQAQDRFLKIGLDWNLPQVCEHLVGLIEDGRRKPRTVSEDVRRLIGEARKRFKFP